MATQGSKSGPDMKPQFTEEPQGDWQKDLNPNHMKGQNIGPDSDLRGEGNRTAHDIKDLHRSLADFRDDELKQIPVLEPGARLQQGATYIDLASERPEEFTARGDVTAQPTNFFIPKDHVPYPIWNRLIGEEKPGQATDDNRTTVPPM